MVANLFAGNGQARGDDPRVIERFGGDIRLIYKKFKFILVTVDKTVIGAIVNQFMMAWCMALVLYILQWITA